jgi:hypothetical protein
LITHRSPVAHRAVDRGSSGDWPPVTSRHPRRYDVEPEEIEGGHVARAKQTGRAEARRRYRQATAAETTEAEDSGAELDYGERKPNAGPRASRPARTADRQPAGRVGIFDSFRLAYRPAHIREDLRAIPELLRSRAFLAGAALLLAGGAAWLLFPVRSGSALAWELLVVPGSALAPQLVGGFFAPRASYLIGFALGILQTLVFVVVSVSPPVVAAYEALAPGTAPQIHADQVLSALVSSAVTGALFAAGAAWYRRFLSLSSPRRAPAPARTNQRRAGGRR